MDKNLPDKWVRKAISDQINNMVVDGITIPCYDSKVPNNENTNTYVLMTTQTNLQLKENKCEDFWQSSILLDCFVRYIKSGNTGSRLLADNIGDQVRNLVNNLVLDVSSNLFIIFQDTNFENDIVSDTKNEIVYRKLIRIELTIR